MFLDSRSAECSVSSPAVFSQGSPTEYHVLSLSLSFGSVCLYSAVGAVAELSVLCDLQFGGVCGRDAVTCLHAVALLQLGQSTH